MSLIESFLVDKTNGILFCRLHRYAVLPDSVASHLTETHQTTTTTQNRLVIQEEVDRLGSEVALKREYSQFVVSKQPVDAYHGLKLYRGSQRCIQCGHITTGASAKANMRQHLRQKHLPLLMDEHSSDETYTKPYNELTTTVTSQRFFVSVPKEFTEHGASQSFEVIDPSPYLPTASTSLPPAEIAADLELHESTISTNTLGLQLAQAEQWAKEGRTQQLAMVPDTPSIEVEPWIAHTNFMAVFGESRRWDQALQYIAIPDARKEPILYFLYTTIKSMVRTWQNTTRITSRYLRIRVMQEDGKDIPLHPFEPYQNMDMRHAAPLQKIFIFFYRTVEEGLPNPPTLFLQPRQQQAWRLLITTLGTIDTSKPVNCEHTHIELSPVELLCHQFWMSLVEQTSCHEDFELTLLTPIAFLSLAPKATGFREVYNFATDLSALKKMVRFASLQQRYLDIPRSTTIQEDSPHGDVTEIEATQLVREQDVARRQQTNKTETTIRAIADDFKAWIYHYLTIGYPTPMNWIINTARFLSRFRYGENLDAFVHWKGDTVTVREVQTSLSKFSHAVWQEYEVTLKLLHELSYVKETSSLPTIPWDSIQDNVRNKERGYSAFSLESSAFQPIANFMHHQLLDGHNAKAFKRTVVTDLQDSVQVQRYCECVQDFLGHLLCLVHLTSGQPARGTELLSIQHENTASNGMRNLFLFSGLVAVVPRYHKGYNRDKTVKTIYRFLPREVGSLLVWYLLLIRPFYIMLQHQVAQEVRNIYHPQATSAFLWPDTSGKQRTSSSWLGTVVARATEEFLGVRINISTLRHLIIAFGRKMDSSTGLKELSREEVEDMLDEQETEARETQAGHSGQTAFACYAVEMGRMFTHHYDKVGAQFRTSTNWHRALHFSPTPEDFDRNSPPGAAAREDRLRQRMNADPVLLLQENFGPHAKFRGQQQQCIKDIMQGETVVVYVAGTGSGKSLLFLLPACFPSYGTCIVIVPLAALRRSLLARCRQLRLTTTVWKGGHCDATASIIFATPESIDNPAFVSLAQRLASLGQLERIVVDECHYVLLPDVDFRPALLRLRSILQYSTPITLLSATLPPTEEKKALERFGLPTDTQVCRESTVRANISYQVRTLGPKKTFTSADLVSYIYTELCVFQKIIVFVEFPSTADELAALLQCEKFHGQMMETEQAGAQERFAHTKQGVIIATSAFSNGIDFDDIDAVIRRGKPPNLPQWNQEAGRAGRRGQKASAILLLHPAIPNHFYNKAEACFKTSVDDFVQETSCTPTCRRQVLDAYFDGDDTRPTCRPTEEKCDVCMDLCKPHAPTGSIVSEPPRTPLRTMKPSPSSAFRSTHQELDTMSSSPIYELSTKKASFGNSLSSYQPDPFGLTETPTPLVLSPKKHYRTSNDFSSSLSSSSPQKRVRSQASHPTPSPHTPSGLQALGYMVARQEREQSYLVAQHKGDISTRARLFNKELPATLAFWREHCIVCFAAQKQFDHPRTESCERLSSLCREYYRKLGNYGKGQCWWCLMPVQLCPKWVHGDSSTVRQNPDKSIPCIGQHVIRDTWVVMWDRCNAVQEKWTDHIRETRPHWNPTNHHDFQSHFAGVVVYDGDFKAGNIVLGLNWVTHTFFLQDL